MVFNFSTGENILKDNIHGWVSVECNTSTISDYLKSCISGNKINLYDDKCVAKIYLPKGTVIYKPQITAFSNPEFITVECGESIKFPVVFPTSLSNPLIFDYKLGKKCYVYKNFKKAYNSYI